MNHVEKISQFLKETGIYFLSTEDGNQPKCRPLGFHTVIDNKIYFTIGDHKDVYKQMQVNPQVEIVASTKKNWLRFYGTAVFEETTTIADGILEGSKMKKIYNEETGKKLAVFHLENATAELRSMEEVEESYHF